MLGSVVLDVAIGMAFVYLLLSLIASVVQEILAAFLQLRSANLQRGLSSLFSGDSMWGENLVDSIYNHGLVRGLYMDPGRDVLQTLLDAQGGAQSDFDDATQAQGVAQAAANAAVPGTQAAADAQAALPAAQKKAADQAARLDQTTQAVEDFKEAQKRSMLQKALEEMRKAMRRFIGVQPIEPVSGVSDTAVLPSYIPSRTFALALIDILNKGKNTGAQAMSDIAASLEQHHSKYKKNRGGEALFALARTADGDLAEFQARVEDWYNDGMDRVSGWYKRNIQRILLYIGIVLAVAFNVDTVRVARTLWSDRDVRTAMVNTAGDYIEKYPGPQASGTQPADASPAPSASSGNAAAASANGRNTAAAPVDADELKNKLNDTVSAFNQVTDSALLPVGWKHSFQAYRENFHADALGLALRGLALVPGWLMTGMAISLGAPFWFDTLNRFMVVRSTIKPQEKSQTEGSKDKA